MQVKVKSLQYRYFLDKYLFSDSYFLQSFLINLHTYSRTLRNIHCPIGINGKSGIYNILLLVLFACRNISGQNESGKRCKSYISGPADS